MSSPFPGMDPYLEHPDRWSNFHNWFIFQLAELHVDAARQLGCWIDVEQDIYARANDGQSFLVGAPDVFVRVDPSASEHGGEAAVQTMTLAPPAAVHSIELTYREGVTHKQRYLAIRETDSFNKVLAVVELLSPSNKRGRDSLRYRRKRRQIIESQTNFLEMDFLRGGRSLSREEFSELPPSPYFLFRSRNLEWKRDFEAFTLRLQDVLPTIGLPLGPGRPDLQLDLAATFGRAYDRSVRPGSIRYGQEPIPAPALSIDDQQWLQQWLAA